MNYELAKQLKEAGFPIPKQPKGSLDAPSGGFPEYYDTDKKKCYHYNFVDFKGRDDMIYIPPLSELINACDDLEEKKTSRGMIYSIHKTIPFKSPYMWEAESYFSNKSGKIKGMGNTPEEAVAKLWLEINDTKIKNTKR